MLSGDTNVSAVITAPHQERDRQLFSGTHNYSAPCENVWILICDASHQVSKQEHFYGNSSSLVHPFRRGDEEILYIQIKGGVAGHSSGRGGLRSCRFFNMPVLNSATNFNFLKNTLYPLKFVIKIAYRYYQTTPLSVMDALCSIVCSSFVI